MEQTSLNFVKLSPQCQKLYDRLRMGPILNTQIRDELALLGTAIKYAGEMGIGVLITGRNGDSVSGKSNRFQNPITDAIVTDDDPGLGGQSLGDSAPT